jgi:hypothetical protein
MLLGNMLLLLTTTSASGGCAGMPCADACVQNSVITADATRDLDRCGFMVFAFNESGRFLFGSDPVERF